MRRLNYPASESKERRSPMPPSRRDSPLILVIDDDPAVVRLIVHQLQNEGFHTTSAEAGPTGISIAEKYQPDAVLLDISLPGTDGYAVCREIKSRLSLAETPVLFITASEPTDAVILRCFEVGANDILSKPVRQVELVARLRVALREQALRQAYRRLAVEDAMTGLANRRQFFAYAVESIIRARQDRTESVLIIGDVDNLMAVNDQYGHDLGDEVLVTFSHLFRRVLTLDCRAGRLGGDELAMVIRNTTRKAAFSLCDRLARTFAAIAFDAKTHPKHFTATFGMAAYDGEPPSFDADAFITHADVALYAAKDLGRSRVVGYWQLDPNALPEVAPGKRHARTKVRKRSQRAAFATLPAAGILSLQTNPASEPDPHSPSVHD